MTALTKVVLLLRPKQGTTKKTEDASTQDAGENYKFCGINPQPQGTRRSLRNHTKPQRIISKH